MELSQVKAKVKGVTISGGTRKSGPVGLLIEGTRARLEDMVWSRCEGASLEVGQASQVLVLNGRFDGNGTALKAADGSQVHMDGCRMMDNALLFDVNSTGSTRGATRLLLYTNEYQGNVKDRSVDARSVLQEGQRLSDAVRSGTTFIP